ncbi:ABC transporter permease [Pelagibacterium sp. 26DY04]|uniref:ABC transporter permease n=1 Tax=unclassified Pelagibacterium TaxID=2623280 RepID=UPI0028169E75|nr:MULTISPECIES: ABC transporter permease [unclassified Pelagibacterium]WMT88619.1 ABC transporter permease [Pelagibacterium sp. 26DY04]WMT90705.1 ABC transporter permease [Pelagibacterium sp. H642]
MSTIPFGQDKALPDRTIETEIDASEAAIDRTAYEGQWSLMWRKFTRHKLGVAGGVVVIVLYIIAAMPEFFSPTGPEVYHPSYTYAPPQQIHLFLETETGTEFRPHVKAYNSVIDYDSGRRVFETSPDEIHEIGLFVSGEPYRLLGLIPTDIHLFGTIEEGAPFYLAGADRLGRDILTRTIHGARISMTIGLIGVGLSLFFGILIGGISGYFGGVTDNVIQRVIEFIQSVPSIPLWIGLAAAIPLDTPPLQVYFFITIILSVIGWTGLARVVRGRFLSMRGDDFVKAARLDGASTLRVLFRHMLPSFTSHIIAVVTLAIPSMILAETALSYIGIGLRQPIVSWGVLLQEAQNVRTIAGAPWLMLPGAAVIIAVLALNFLGDGLRDAADPYQN